MNKHQLAWQQMECEGRLWRSEQYERLFEVVREACVHRLVVFPKNKLASRRFKAAAERRGSDCALLPLSFGCWTTVSEDQQDTLAL